MCEITILWDARNMLKKMLTPVVVFIAQKIFRKIRLIKLEH